MKAFIRNILSTTLLVAVSAVAQTSIAATNSPGIDNLQANQKNRIAQGVYLGELTKKEAWRLGQQQRRTHKKEQRFKADGKFNRRERAIINVDLEYSSRNIYKQKHDRQRQGQYRWGKKPPTINTTQKHQKQRIKQGVRSGSLTPREANKLKYQQQRIQHKKRHFKADGNFTKRERLKIRKKQNRASKNIYRKKHNAKHR